MYTFVGLVTHYSCRLGLMVFFYYLYSQFLVALIIGLFYPLGFHKWPSTVTKHLLDLHRVDELKNFTADNLLSWCFEVAYWDPRNC